MFGRRRNDFVSILAWSLGPRAPPNFQLSISTLKPIYNYQFYARTQHGQLMLSEGWSYPYVKPWHEIYAYRLPPRSIHSVYSFKIL